MVRKANLLMRFLALLLLSCALFSMMAFSASASGGEEQTAEARSGGKTYLSVKGIQNTNVSAYQSVKLSFNGKSVGVNALIINGEYYIPVKSFVGFAAPDMTVTYSSSSKTLVISGGGLYLTATDSSFAVYANDRVLFELTPARLMSDGFLYIPAKTLAKALSLSVTVSSSGINLKGTVRAITPAKDFYAEDAVYWLSRIISAESRGEPLIGQIAVGNVIMNRVRSQSFPNPQRCCKVPTPR